RLRGQDVNVASSAGSVDLVIDDERRGGEATISQALQPDALAGAGVVTAGEAGIVDEVEVCASGHGAGDVWKILAVVPERLGRVRLASARQGQTHGEPAGIPTTTHAQNVAGQRGRCDGPHGGLEGMVLPPLGFPDL